MKVIYFLILLILLIVPMVAFSGICEIEDPGPIQRKKQWEKSFLSLRNSKLYFVKKYKDRYQTETINTLLSPGMNILHHSMILKMKHQGRKPKFELKMIKYQIEVVPTDKCSGLNEPNYECSDPVEGISHIAIRKYTAIKKAGTQSDYKLAGVSKVNDFSCLDHIRY